MSGKAIEPGDSLLIRRPELKRLLGITKDRTLYEYIKNKSIPPPFKYLSRATPVWRRKDLEKWIGHAIQEKQDAER